MPTQEELDICTFKITDLTATNEVYFEDNIELIEESKYHRHPNPFEHC